MITRVNYTLVGVFVFGLGCLLAFSGVWLFSKHGHTHFKTYETYMDEAVFGLDENSTVRFNGVPVGYVSDIALNPSNPQQVRLLLKIKSTVNITTATIATLKSQGITGLTYVGLKASKQVAALLTPRPGHHYPTITSEPSLIVELGDALRRITGNIAQVSRSFNDVFSPKNTKELTETLHHLNAISGSIADNDATIAHTLAKLKIVVANSAKASVNFPAMTAQLAKGLKQLNNTLHHVNQLSQQAKLTLKRSDATLQNASQQTLPNLTQVLSRLNNTSRTLGALSRELQANPALLVRGRAPQPLGPGERR